MFDVDENKTVDRTEFLVVIFVIIWLVINSYVFSKTKSLLT